MEIHLRIKPTIPNTGQQCSCALSFLEFGITLTAQKMARKKLSSRQEERWMRAPIGEMVIAFNRLEENAHFVLWRLTDAPPGVAQALCAGLSFSQVLERLLTVAEVVKVPENLQNQLRKIVGEARTLNQERNKFVHASWVNFGDEGLHRTRIKPDCFQLDKIARTEVRTLAVQIKECDRKLHEWSGNWRPFERYRMRTPEEIAAYDAANSNKNRGATS